MTLATLFVLGAAHSAIAQQTSTPSTLLLPSNLFGQYAITNNQIQVARSLANIPVTEIPLSSTLTQLSGLPIFVLQQVNQELGSNSNNQFARAREVQFALDQLAPNLYTDLPYLTFDNTETLYSSLEQRMDEIRFGAYGFSGPPALEEAPITGTSKDGKEVKNPAVPAPAPSEPRWGTYAYLNGKFGELHSDGNGFGFNYQAGGVVIGADYRITDKIAIGVAGGYEYANLDPKVVGGQGSANAGYGAIYTTYGGSTGLYAEAIGGVGYTAYDVQRNVLGTAAHGYPSGWDASAGGTLGYMFKLTNNLGFAPFGQIFYDNLWRSGASESGSVARLSVAHGSAETLDTIVGGKLVGAFYLGRMRVTNTLWAAYRHDYLENVYAVSSTFIDGGVNSFVTQGPRFSADSVVAGAGVNADVTRNISVSFGYQAEANSDYLGNLFSLGVKYKY